MICMHFRASIVIYIHLYLDTSIMHLYTYTCTLTGTNIRMYINTTFSEARSSQPVAPAICLNQKS